jgi:hypothetical protein
MAASPWKAPGEDGLPMVVWKQTWPVVKDRILSLFQASLSEGVLPQQWRHAKIIPLKKPNKGDYTKAKAWRPISLLSTLGKILEAVIAERISYLAETYGLLPANHFGARKQRSPEQALILLQEQIYRAWRSRKVVSLISFDVKGAYNGVYKDRLIQRLRARGIPTELTRWIDAFCSDRTASVMINKQDIPRQNLPQAGLPQGSPLSPILFLFFNADLVQSQNSPSGGSMAFVDDYTAWVTGDSAAANHRGIESLIDRATAWEKRSGATFEGEKTTIIHFTRNPGRADDRPFTIKGAQVIPKDTAKILGVIMDSQLRFKQHIANAATKGLKAAMALRRLTAVTPATARQLFTATVAPVVDYASNVWAHACNSTAQPAVDRVQKMGAQAITGAFKTVAVAVLEAEASIASTQQRLAKRALKLWIGLHTLPDTNPLSRLDTRMFQRFVSPLQRIANAYQGVPVNKMETVYPFALSPWEKRMHVMIEPDREKAADKARNTQGITIATSCSQRNGLLGFGVAIHDTMLKRSTKPTIHAHTVATRAEQNPYTAELEAIAFALKQVPQHTRRRQITLISSNMGALLSIAQPKQQSGQQSHRKIYEEAQNVRRQGNELALMWAPAGTDLMLGKMAKSAAKSATRVGRQPDKDAYQAKSTTFNRAKRGLMRDRQLPANVGKYSKEVDTALPGQHTRRLYDKLNRPEANTLAQLRTGMARLNSYLHRIGAVDSAQCPCGHAVETVKHFLFTCSLWTHHRSRLLDQTETRRGSISFFVGGKTRSDPDKWTPNMQAVRATIGFATATGRLQQER